MDTVIQIQDALERLSTREREVIADWLQKLMEAQLPGVAEPRSSNAAVQPPFMTVEEYLPASTRVCQRLVAEILSASTQHIARREKAMTYRRIASLEEYVLLAQDDRQVTVQRRAENWRPQSYSGPQATVEFRSIGLGTTGADLRRHAITG